MRIKDDLGGGRSSLRSRMENCLFNVNVLQFKSRLIMLRIGITGHRILADGESIERGIDAALSKISGAYSDKDWTLISSLAEGADCLVVEYALNYRSARLIVPLPMEVNEYLKEFSMAYSRITFEHLLRRADEVITLPSKSDKETAYLEAGKYILSVSDILIAVWDGENAQGRGGTGEIVQLARQQGLPLAWILAGNRRPGTLEPISLNEKQGNVIFERFPFA